jgi:hypothetical protein
MSKETKELIDILNSGGFTTVSGYDSVIKTIENFSDKLNKKLCSGYGVFPGGEKCKGCSDCGKELAQDEKRIK